MSQDNYKAASRLYRKLHKGGEAASGGLEAVSGPPEPDLSDARAYDAFERAKKIAQHEWGSALDPDLIRMLEKIYLQDGVAGLEQLRDAGEDAVLTGEQRGGLEAVVQTDGSRPTLQFAEDGSFDTHAEILNSWQATAQKYCGEIREIASSVGRIDGGREYNRTFHKGTGFVIKDNLVLTNRHVLQQIARHRNGEWKFHGRAPTITFDANPNLSRSLEFHIKRVVLAGPDRIRVPLNYTRLDFAVLECEVSSGSSFPLPLTLHNNADGIKEAQYVYTIGYPAKPEDGVYEPSVLSLLFQTIYGVKRFAPGEIDEEVGTVAPTVFAHDATTLGGNSGSCIVDLEDNGKLVVGLHFAGFAEDANYAHAFAKLQDSLWHLDLAWAASL